MLERGFSDDASIDLGFAILDPHDKLDKLFLPLNNFVEFATYVI